MRRAVLLLSMALASVVAPLLVDALGARGALITTGLLLLAAMTGNASAEGADDVVSTRLQAG